MRLLNDKDQEKDKSPESGVFPMISHSIFSAFGIMTVIFAPLPMISAHLRMKQPWPKVAALMGAVLALTLFKVPLLPVVMTFIFSLYVADSVNSRGGFWILLGKGMAVAVLIGFVSLFVVAEMNQMGLWAFWSHLVDGLLNQLRETVKTEPNFQWDTVKAMLLYEGPFLFLSGAVLSIWLSIGIAAHLAWFSPEHHLSGSKLKKLRLPVWASIAFVVLFVAEIAGALKDSGAVGGIYRVAGTLMFIQGCVCLSEVLSLRGLNRKMRTLVYSIAILLGFYVLVGMGVIGPWFFRWQERLKARQPVE